MEAPPSIPPVALCSPGPPSLWGPLGTPLQPSRFLPAVALGEGHSSDTFTDDGTAWTSWWPRSHRGLTSGRRVTFCRQAWLGASERGPFVSSLRSTHVLEALPCSLFFSLKTHSALPQASRPGQSRPTGPECG